MRILQVCASLSPLHGGPTEAAINLNVALNAAGHQARILATDEHDGRPDRSLVAAFVRRRGAEARLFRVHAPAGRQASVPMLLALPNAVRRSDVVHVHGILLWHFLWAALWCRVFRVPLVAQAHGIFEPYQMGQSATVKRMFFRFGGTWALAGAAAIAVDTEEEREVALIPEKARRVKIVILAPAPAPPPEPTSHRRNADGTSPHLLFLARIAPKKRVDLAISAMPLILKEFPGAHLTIAGDDALGLAAAALDELPDDARDRISMVGFVDGQAKDDLLAEADVYLLASENENYGISVYEALLAGVPVCISRHVALAGPVEAARAGRIVADLSAEAVSEAVAGIVADPQMPANAGRLGRELNSPAKAAEDAVRIYRGLTRLSA